MLKYLLMFTLSSLLLAECLRVELQTSWPGSGPKWNSAGHPMVEASKDKVNLTSH